MTDFEMTALYEASQCETLTPYEQLAIKQAMNELNVSRETIFVVISIDASETCTCFFCHNDNYITTNKRQALIKAVYLTDIHDEVIICSLDYWKKTILSDDPTFIKVKNLEKQGIVLYNNMNKM